MFHHALKDSAVHGNIPFGAEVKRSGGKDFRDVGRDLVSLLLFIVIWFVMGLRLVVGLYQFAGLVDVDLALDMLAGSLVQIVRCLQAIHCLQADGSLPNRGFFPLFWLALANILVKVDVCLFSAHSLWIIVRCFSGLGISPHFFPGGIVEVMCLSMRIIHSIQETVEEELCIPC